MRWKVFEFPFDHIPSRMELDKGEVKISLPRKDCFSNNFLPMSVEGCFEGAWGEKKKKKEKPVVWNVAWSATLDKIEGGVATYIIEDNYRN